MCINRDLPKDETLQRSKTDSSIRSQSAPLESTGLLGGEWQYLMLDQNETLTAYVITCLPKPIHSVNRLLEMSGIDYFTSACFTIIARPLNEIEAGVDLIPHSFSYVNSYVQYYLA